MSKKIVIGNWKMNPLSLKEAEKLFTGILKIKKEKLKTDVVACPPFIYLEKLSKISKKISLGAQDVFYEKEGAYTGEISGEMLYNLGARYTIIGHSERRKMGEENIDVNKKIKSALAFGLTPIVCVGERVRDENHEYLSLIKAQVEEGFAGIVKTSVPKIIIAYEPVWAIGKNAVREATAEEFREMKIFIRKILTDKFGKTVAESIRTIYGGSANPKNANDFLVNGQADGFLGGRDSLTPEKFVEIINITEKI